MTGVVGVVVGGVGGAVLSIFYVLIGLIIIDQRILIFTKLHFRCRLDPSDPGLVQCPCILSLSSLSDE